MYSSEQKKLVQQSLEKIFQSEGFSSAPQLRNFLEFVVQKTLNDHADEIKGYTIGVDALGRPPNFDPQTDPVVRVMAGRLRQALKNHNSESRNDNQVTIDMKKGSYIPIFDFENVTSTPPDASTPRQNLPSFHPHKKTPQPQDRTAQDNSFFRPQIFNIMAVLAIILATTAIWITLRPAPSQDSLPPVHIQLNPNATRISISLTTNDDPIPAWFSSQEAIAGLVTAFSRFNEFMIYQRPWNDDGSNPNDLKSDYHFSVLITRAGSSDDVRAFAKLTRRFDNAVIWSKVIPIAKPLTDHGIDASKISGEVISPLLSPYGVIYADISNHKPVPQHLECINRIYSYFASETSEQYSAARACINTIIKTGNASSSFYALLTFLQIEVYRKKLSGYETDPLSAADVSARKAIATGPQNARAHQALFGIHKIRGNKNKAIAAALKALELNPYDSDIAGDFAAYLVSIGNFRQAAPILEKAQNLNPSAPVWLEVYLFLQDELTGNFAEADMTASRLNPDSSPMAAVAIIMSATRNNNALQADKALSALIRQEPDFARSPFAALSRRGFSPSIAEKIAAVVNTAYARYSK